MYTTQYNTTAIIQSIELIDEKKLAGCKKKLDDPKVIQASRDAKKEIIATCIKLFMIIIRLTLAKF